MQKTKKLEKQILKIIIIWVYFQAKMLRILIIIHDNNEIFVVDVSVYLNIFTAIKYLLISILIFKPSDTWKDY